jgi:ABC-2 type transport system ATP-binding protein
VYDGTIDDLHTTFASTRMLVVDLADPAAIITPGPGWADAEVVRAEGARRWIRFAGERISAARLVASVLAQHEVKDLSIVEPDIEDVIRRIYRGETRAMDATPSVTDWRPKAPETPGY